MKGAGLSTGAQKRHNVPYPGGAHGRMCAGKQILTMSLMSAGIGRKTVMWEQGGNWKED